MNVRIYTDIIIDGSRFSIKERQLSRKEKHAFIPRDLALTTLKHIEEVILKELTYSVTADDCNSQLSQAELREQLKLKAKRIMDNYLNKSQSISFIRRFFGGVVQKEQNIKSTYERIISLSHPVYITTPKITTGSTGNYYLTGKVKEQNLNGASLECRKNLEAGKKIIEKTQRTILFSSNYPQRSKVIRKLSKQVHTDNTSRNLYEKGVELIGDKIVKMRNSRHFYHTRNRLTKLAIKSGVGNCQEMALCGLRYAEELGIPAEKWYIGGGDHTFLVIGRSQSQWWSDYRYWDSATVICDPWSGSLFPATHLESYLINYIQYSKIDGIYMTQIEPFDPKKHTLLR